VIFLGFWFMKVDDGYMKKMKKMKMRKKRKKAMCW
jgi:hypothetical protein